MEIDFGTLLSPEPILLSIGTLRKPTLREISRLTFPKFSIFEAFLKISIEEIYELSAGEEGTKWEDLPGETKDSLTVYGCILNDEHLQSLYQSIFNFFFVEEVVFYQNYFVLLKEGHTIENIDEDSIVGVISEKNFNPVLEIIQQICCIYEKKEEEKIPHFKNEMARKMYERMKKAKAEQAKQKNQQKNLDYSLPNIISAVSNRHPALTPVTVWDMTLFQLIDSFNRLQVNTVYDIDKTRVSVWGDQKKKFDISLWFKNSQEKPKEDDI